MYIVIGGLEHKSVLKARRRWKLLAWHCYYQRPRAEGHPASGHFSCMSRSQYCFSIDSHLSRMFPRAQRFLELEVGADVIARRP
eukprot:4070643-Amphidinium_carterae.1